MSHIVALHGNLGSPEDWLELETHCGLQFDKRCLWKPGALKFAQGDILLGYSLGGRLALQAAVVEPSKFSAVIVLSAHPGLPIESDRQSRLQTDANWARLALDLPWQDFLQQWDAQEVLGPNDKKRMHLVKWRSAIAEGFTKWSLGRQDDLRPALKSLRCPLVWITGANDGKFTELASTAGYGEHFPIADAGHRVHFDQPAKVSAILQPFIPPQR